MILNQRFFVPRFLALFLSVSLGLALPAPAGAMRNLQPADNAGLEEEIARTLHPAAGMEEGGASEDLDSFLEELTPAQRKMWEFLTGASGTLVTFTEVDLVTGKGRGFQLAALGLNPKSVRSQVALLGSDPRTLESHWRYLTGEAGSEIELTEIDGETKEAVEYRLPALGLNPKSVRNSVSLLGRDPRTLESHWRYLTGHWPYLETILRKTPVYLGYSLWDRYALRASYLEVLSHRWTQRMGQETLGCTPWFGQF